MILAILKMMPRDEKRQEVLDILLSVKEPVLAEPGCISCSIFEESEEENLLYLEQWRSLTELERHIRGDSYSKILQALELSSQVPEISYYETGTTWNLELVERVRDSGHQIAAHMLQNNRVPVH